MGGFTDHAAVSVAYNHCLCLSMMGCAGGAQAVPKPAAGAVGASGQCAAGGWAAAQQLGTQYTNSLCHG